MSAARICLGRGDEKCYSIPSRKGFFFGLEPTAIPAGQMRGKPLILFSAMFSGCGSGTLTHYSLLVVRDQGFVNLLPEVELTNQSEDKLWLLPTVSSAPIMVTADFIWDKKETHFASHFYEISAYVYDPGVGRYVRKLEYKSAKRYPGLDEVDEVKVLEAEKPIILSRLGNGIR